MLNWHFPITSHQCPGVSCDQLAKEGNKSRLDSWRADWICWCELKIDCAASQFHSGESEESRRAGENPPCGQSCRQCSSHPVCEERHVAFVLSCGTWFGCWVRGLDATRLEDWGWGDVGEEHLKGSQSVGIIISYMNAQQRDSTIESETQQPASWTGWRDLLSAFPVPVLWACEWSHQGYRR